jgi:hypothetical protein
MISSLLELSLTAVQGQAFARGEMLCLVAALVGRFEFVLKNKDDYDEAKIKVSNSGFSAKPNKGMEVKARIANNW